MAAYNRVCALFFISLLFSSSNPLAHAQLTTRCGISTVVGRLCCTRTGNCPGQGVAGVPVSLNCTIRGVTTTIGQAITNVNGTFNITVPALTGLFLGLPIIPCIATVQLPLSPVLCPVLSTTNGTVLPLLFCPLSHVSPPIIVPPPFLCFPPPVVYSCIFQRF